MAKNTRTIKLELNLCAARYLDWLAAHDVLGVDASDVARFILTRELELMLRDEYHEKVLAWQKEFAKAHP